MTAEPDYREKEVVVRVFPDGQTLEMIGMAAAQEKSGLTVQYVTILHAPTVMLSKPSPRRQTRCLQQVAQ